MTSIGLGPGRPLGEGLNRGGSLHGNILTMKSTIDSAGRLVIPSAVRREAGLEPGTPVEVRCRDGVVEIEPHPILVKLERRGRLLVAIPQEGSPRLPVETVERTRRALQRERSGSW